MTAIDDDSAALRAPIVSELSGGSAFVTLETRRGVTQSFTFIPADTPVANVLLFAGGDGVLGLTSSNPAMPAKLKGNFLIRSREKFTSKGLNVVLVDAPSDRQTGMQGGFRTSRYHVKDIEGVIDFLRQRTRLPIWLVGTSRGTESATYVAIHSRAPVDGLILTSPITVSNRKGTNISALDLDEIRAPVQIVYHESDGCQVTPPWGAAAIGDSLSNAKVVEVKAFNGGEAALSGACQGKSEHGFFGIEEQVAASIAAFIKANQ